MEAGAQEPRRGFGMEATSNTDPTRGSLRGKTFSHSAKNFNELLSVYNYPPHPHEQRSSSVPAILSEWGLILMEPLMIA